MNKVPHGCVGRIGAEYDFFDEKWKLHRVDGAPLTYIFRAVTHGSGFIYFTLRRFLKLTKHWDGARTPSTPYRIPCFQCRVLIDGRDGSIFSNECRPS